MSKKAKKEPVDKGKKAYLDLHENAREWCNQNCPSELKNRCCFKEFCDLALLECDLEWKEYYNPNRGVPFMRPGGCQLPADQRPHCTGYVCDHFILHGPYKAHKKIVERMPLRDRITIKRSLEPIEAVAAEHKKLNKTSETGDVGTDG